MRHVQLRSCARRNPKRPKINLGYSPRYQPAGLLIQYGKTFVLIDGGSKAPKSVLAAWLVTDEKGELIRQIRKLAGPMGLEPAIASFTSDKLAIAPYPVIHTSHNAYGYTIKANGKKIVWVPEFLKFPRWAKGANLMFAEAAAWNRPILFPRPRGRPCIRRTGREWR